MKKTVLVLITFALVIAVAGSGFWLVHYFIDSREQRQTYETLAEEFVLESTPTPESIRRPESSSSLDSSVDAGGERCEFSCGPAQIPRPGTTWQPWQRKMRIAWAGSPSQTRGSTTPSCTRRIPRSTTCAGISTANSASGGTPFPGWSERCPEAEGQNLDPLRPQHDGRQYV